MKKTYLTPSTQQSDDLETEFPIAISGNTGDGTDPIGGGGDDHGGEGEPDSKSRGGFDGWGDLW